MSILVQVLEMPSLGGRGETLLMAFPKKLPTNLENLRGKHSVFEIDHSLGYLHKQSLTQDIVQWIEPHLQRVDVNTAPHKMDDLGNNKIDTFIFIFRHVYA